MSHASKTPKRGVRVGIYARYSSDRQSEHSIEDQLRICRVYAEREGWQLARCFSHAGISGTTLLRPGLQALQLAMRNGEVDIVLTEALDRLSRDQEHIAALHKLAGYTGVRLVTLNEGEVGSIHVGLRGAMSAMYLEDLVAKTMRGIEGRIRAGRAIGPPPYGYRRTTAVLRPDGKIERGLREIDPEHAAVVRRIFECFAGGMTLWRTILCSPRPRIPRQRCHARPLQQSQGDQARGARSPGACHPGRADDGSRTGRGIRG